MCRKARSGVQQVRSMPHRRHNGSSRQERSSRQCKGLRCRNAAQQGLRPRPHSAPQHRKLLPLQIRRGVHLHAPRQGVLQTKARQALRPLLPELKEFIAKGKVIIANGSSGAILAKTLTRLDGTVIEGLGLLGMHWKERTRVHGDDLWLNAMDGVEVIGNEIRLADITLDEGQEPFASVRYGRGNCGDGLEGARSGNVIYTGCLGPVLVRNPLLAMEYLKLGAKAAGIYVDPLRFIPDPEDVEAETRGIQESRAFIQKKINSAKEKEKKSLKNFFNSKKQRNPIKN